MIKTNSSGDRPDRNISHLFPLLLIGHVVTYIVLIKGGASERCDFSQFGKDYRIIATAPYILILDFIICVRHDKSEKLLSLVKQQSFTHSFVQPSHCQTLTHNVVSGTPHLRWIRTHNFSGNKH
jgi:hypothetical protein